MRILGLTGETCDLAFLFLDRVGVRAVLGRFPDFLGLSSGTTLSDGGAFDDFTLITVFNGGWVDLLTASPSRVGVMRLFRFTLAGTVTMEGKHVPSHLIVFG